MQVVVLSNRGDAYVHDAIASLTEHVTGWDELTIVDDSGEENHRARMAVRYPDAQIVPVAPEPAGYRQAMATAFDVMAGRHALFWEEDFRALVPVDLDPIANRLDDDPWLAQIALLRGPWFGNEHLAGGVIEAREAQGAKFTRVDGLIRHVDHFTSNPSVLPRWVWGRGWPEGDWSESRFGRQLVADGFGFAYLDGGVMVDHVGVREGFGY